MQADTSPLVSVITTTFNGERFIEAALRSLCDQAGVNLELVVVDDSSSDATLSILRRLAEADPRIRVLAEPHRGIAASRNTGLAAARGSHITFLDQDDLCPPGRIARQLGALGADPSAAAIIGETLLFEELGDDWQPLPGTPSARVLGIQLGATLFTRDVIDTVGGFDTGYTMGDDFDLMLRIIEAGYTVLTESEVAALHRRHKGNTSGDLNAVRQEILKVFASSLARRRAKGQHGPLRHPLVRDMSAALAMKTGK